MLPADEKEWSATQLGMIFKFEQQRETILGNIRIADDKIAKADEMAARFRASGNGPAEAFARSALRTAQENKTMLETRKLQIDRNIAYVRNRMNDRSGYDTKIAGMVTGHTGRVRVISGKPPYEASEVNDERPGYFEKGDTIETYDASGAEVQFLDGRGSLKVGENSRVKMEQKDSLSEILSLAKGKIYASVEKAAVFEAWLERQAQMAADDPNKLLEQDVKAIHAWVKGKSKKFEVRTPTAVIAVRGTTFVIESDEGGSSIELIEGEITVGSSKGGDSKVLKGGEKMRVSADGTMTVEPLNSGAKRWWK